MSHAVDECVLIATRGSLCEWADLPSSLQWMSEGKTEASIYQQAEDGKTELSLMHFAITNPQWQPPQETTHFISQLKERVHREATGAPSDTHPLSLSESEVR